MIKLIKTVNLMKPALKFTCLTMQHNESSEERIVSLYYYYYFFSPKKSDICDNLVLVELKYSIYLLLFLFFFQRIEL